MITIQQQVRECGGLVRMARKYYGFTLPQLAEMAGISKGALSKIENGGNFTIETLCRLARAMDLELTQIFDEDSFNVCE